jgi:hypothetical protein
MRRIAILAGLVLLAAGLPSQVAASTAPTFVPKGLQTAVFHSPTSGPTVASGTLRDRAGAALPGWVALLAWPTEKVTRTVGIGQSVAIPTVGWARAGSDGRFSVRIDPKLIPDGYLSDQGQVDLDVLGWTATALGVRSFSAQLGTANRAQAAEMNSIAKPASLDVSARGAIRETSPVNASTAASAGGDSGAGPLAYCDGTRVGTYSVWTRVADTWPYFSNSYGWVEIEASHSETVGIGVTVGGTWSESGTHTTSSGFSWTPPGTTYYREWDIEMDYGKWYYSCTWEYKFYPDGPGGGTISYSIPYQNKWNGAYCSHVDPGVWKRELSDYNHFSLSGGVKSSSVIGINLSINTDYSTTSGVKKKTVYQLTQWSYLCGSNAKPAWASRITDIGHNTP